MYHLWVMTYASEYSIHAKLSLSLSLSLSALLFKYRGIYTSGSLILILQTALNYLDIFPALVRER